MLRNRALVLSLLLFACAAPRTSEDERAWLDSLDTRYTGFDRALTLAGWQRAVGEEPLDTAAAEVERASFFADDEQCARLVELARGPDAELAARAGAWLRFLARERLEVAPEILEVNERVRQAMDAGGPPAGELVGTLVFDPDPEAERRALAEIEARSRAVLPLFQERVRLLDSLARAAGAPDAATFYAGPSALAELEATCRAQQERTQADWDALLVALERRLGRRAELADCIGATVSWSKEASAFFTGDNVGALAQDAAARMGFDVGRMGIVVRMNPGGVGGSAFGVSIPDDVRFQGNFEAYPRGYFHELGHAIHMKRVRAPHLPERLLPQDRALNEGVGEIFALVARDPVWLAAALPDVPASQREEFLACMRGYDAMAVRFNGLQARLEQELYAGHDVEQRWPILFRETFGREPTLGPTWLLFVPSYLTTPFYLRAYVYQAEVRDTFVRRLAGRALVSPEGGRFLDETMLAPGNGLTLDAYLREPHEGR